MQRDVTILWGRTGSGKSRYARHLTRGATRLLVCDPNGEPDVSLDWPPTLGGVFDSMKRPTWRLGWQPDGDEWGDLLHGSMCAGTMTLRIEEVDLLGDPREEPDWYEAIFRGRHKGLSLVCTTLHPFRTQPDLRRQATRLVTYAQHEPNDLLYISKSMGGGKELSERIQSLPPFHALSYDTRTGDMKEIGPDYAEIKITRYASDPPHPLFEGLAKSDEESRSSPAPEQT